MKRTINSPVKLRARMCPGERVHLSSFGVGGDAVTHINRSTQ